MMKVDGLYSQTLSGELLIDPSTKYDPGLGNNLWPTYRFKQITRKSKTNALTCQVG